MCPNELQLSKKTLKVNKLTLLIEIVRFHHINDSQRSVGGLIDIYYL